MADLEPAERPSTHTLLELQRAETSLVRAVVSGQVERPPDISQVRYLLGFCRLTTFQPGAALAGRRNDRPDVTVAQEVEPLRRRVANQLCGPLKLEADPVSRIALALEIAEQFMPDLAALRESLITGHANDFSADELDAECGRKHLVLVGGGGGGAGWVYVGAGRRMEQARITPSYLLGASMGSLIGLLLCRDPHPNWDDYIALAHNLDRRDLFSPISLKRRYGLPGLLSLRLNESLDHLFRHEDGTPVRVDELAVPYETVVAGVRKAAFDKLPRRFRATAVSVRKRVAPLAKYTQRSLAPAVATRMWQVAAFIDPRVVKPIIFGADSLTAEAHALDAAGFSCAIPGVLHYDIADGQDHMDQLLTKLVEREKVSALVDGGVASNVPAEQAWRRVQNGKIGTRNAFILAWDCFHPQWDPRHLWLQPITQAIALQHVRNAPFADWIIRFKPTLSPIDLVPTPERFDKTLEWGAQAMEPIVPMLTALLEPVVWKG